ncbi:hypothetical protein AACH06_29020 [Ideonella sp. DXS29W]|uniref:Uncharacterized protein n=1 Tax=Ideonella lacteola TaxID=2984193 RepID=A0ABU9C1E9_9BURK
MPSTSTPRRFNRKEVLDGLINHPPEWAASIRDQYDGSWDLLLDDIAAKLPGRHKRSLTETLLGRNPPAAELTLLPEHIHFGAALIHAGRREGVDAVLNALTGDDRTLRRMALVVLQGMHAEKMGREGQPGTLPLSIDELTSALGVALRNVCRNRAAWCLAGS